MFTSTSNWPSARELFPVASPPFHYAYDAAPILKMLERGVHAYEHPTGSGWPDILTGYVRMLCEVGYGLAIRRDQVSIFAPKFIAAYEELLEQAGGLDTEAPDYIRATLAWFRRHYPLPTEVVGVTAVSLGRYPRNLPVKLDACRAAMLRLWRRFHPRRE